MLLVLGNECMLFHLNEPNPRLQLTAKAPSANLEMRYFGFDENESWTQVGGS